MDNHPDIARIREIIDRIDSTAFLVAQLPPSRERSIARTELDAASLWLGAEIKRLKALPEAKA